MVVCSESRGSESRAPSDTCHSHLQHNTPQRHSVEVLLHAHTHVYIYMYITAYCFFLLS